MTILDSSRGLNPKTFIKELYNINQGVKTVSAWYIITPRSICTLACSSDTKAQNSVYTYMSISDFIQNNYVDLRSTINEVGHILIDSLTLFQALKTGKQRNSVARVEVSTFENINYLSLFDADNNLIISQVPDRKRIQDACLYIIAYNRYLSEIYRFNERKPLIAKFTGEAIRDIMKNKRQFALDVPKDDGNYKTFISAATINGPYIKKAESLDVVYLHGTVPDQEGYIVRYISEGLYHHLYYRSLSFKGEIL